MASDWDSVNLTQPTRKFNIVWKNGKNLAILIYITGSRSSILLQSLRNTGQQEVIVMGQGRILKIVVHEGGQEEPKVEVTVPLKLAKWALKLMPVAEGKIKEHTDMDLNALKELLDEGFGEMEELGQFDLVKVNDGDTKVKISIEVE